MKADNFKRNREGYLQEIRVELRGNAGVLSISSMSQNRENDDSEYAEGLLEKILDRDNMNSAYRKVKASRGSHGVDGMTVDELLPFLKQNGSRIKQSIREGPRVMGCSWMKELRIYLWKTILSII